MVLQALNRAKLVDERDPEYHLQLAKFCDLGTSSLRELHACFSVRKFGPEMYHALPAFSEFEDMG